MANYDKLMQAALKKLENETAKKEKKETKKKATVTKHITIEQVEQAYQKLGKRAMQSEVFFYDGNPMMQKAYVKDDACTPVGALVLLKKQSLKPEEEIQFTALLDEPSESWSVGTIGQFLDYQSSYILGFNSGFDGNPPGHANCSQFYHAGHDDGKALLGLMVEQGLVSVDKDDPYEDEEDVDILVELTRCEGYWREDWGIRPYNVGDRIADIRDLYREDELEVEESEEIVSSEV